MDLYYVRLFTRKIFNKIRRTEKFEKIETLSLKRISMLHRCWKSCPLQFKCSKLAHLFLGGMKQNAREFPLDVYTPLLQRSSCLRSLSYTHTLYPAPFSAKYIFPFGINHAPKPKNAVLHAAGERENVHRRQFTM